MTKSWRCWTRYTPRCAPASRATRRRRSSCCRWGNITATRGSIRARSAAATMVATTIMNFDEAVYKR